jgi:8-oxo-dGTP pyrophosphatase MutT (NUDIX family)
VAYLKVEIHRGWHAIDSYVTSMRKLIGQKPLILVAAGAIILDDRRRVLLQLRTDDGRWGIPGGTMEPGETVEQCAMREVLEETRLTLDELRLFGIYSGEQQHHTYPNGDEVYCVNVVFLSTAFHGTLRGDANETVRLQFHDMDRFPQQITPLCSPVLKELRDRMVRDPASLSL